MHRELAKKLLCPSCRDMRSELRPVAFREQGPIILDGVLSCPSCGGWYPISDALLELVVPSLMDTEGLAVFARTYGKELTAAQCRLPDAPASQATVEAQVEQRRHFDWYAENETQDYNAYQNTPFWRAADQIAFARWKSMVRRNSWVLDVGSADGRSSFQWTDLADNVAGFDISKKMIRKAIERSRSAGCDQRTSFFVGDADRIPVRDGAFDYACTYGVLHHVPNPEQSYRDIIRLLRPGGIFFASENNKSAFRGLFDLMMKMLPLWTELAGEEPLISAGMIKSWSRDLNIDLSIHTAVFLPPHLFNMLGHGVARHLMKISDRVNQAVPWVRGQGGLIIIESRKK